MSEPECSWQLNTRLVHSAQDHTTTSGAGQPTIPPIYASTTYLHAQSEALDQAFSGQTAAGDPAFVYTRHGNMSTQPLEESLAQAEGGVGAVVFGSGMAAIHAALVSCGLAPQSKIMIASDAYGASTALIRQFFVPMGIELIVSDLCSPDAAQIIEAEAPDVVIFETISNPLVKVIDVAAICQAAREVDAITIVDSTMTTPYLLRPIELGADLVVHSMTKYIGGHGDSIGGVVISAKRLLLDQVRNASIYLGATLSPFEIHLQMRGLRTLALRMERHCENALKVAQFLAQHPGVAAVHYSGLPEHPHHQLASSLFGNRYGGMLAFELVQQTSSAAFALMDNFKLCLPVTSLGDVFTLVTYPAVSSHRSITPGERAKIGITEGCIRLSVGIEDVQDIIEDLDQALARV